MDELGQLLERVKREAHGKLPREVYRRIHDSAFGCGGGALVEVGTSQGAATMAMALGARRAGRPFRIYTFDVFRIGSRPVGSSVEEKHEVVRRGFAAFGLAEDIHSFPAGVELLPSDVGPIRMLLIDADGRIDRDLAALYERLDPDCPIVIDDIDGEAYLHRRGRGFQLDQKHRITRLLIDAFVREGLLVIEDESCQTGWYRKGSASACVADIEAIALPCYRALVSTDVGLRALSFKYHLYQRLARHVPWSISLYRRLRRR